VFSIFLLIDLSRKAKALPTDVAKTRASCGFLQHSHLTVAGVERTILELSRNTVATLDSGGCGGPRMTFQIGDKVVYPNQGVGTIENISSRSFGSAFERFYLLRFGCNSMTVLVPFSNAANIGLRRVTKDREISRVLSYLSNGVCICSSDWKVRFKENTVKMQSGDLLRAAEVFKALVQILGQAKSLSFREKKMLERARHMLVSEISISRSVPEITAMSVLQRALGKAGLLLPANL
jgi:CarD family transcriptional regulator